MASKTVVMITGANSGIGLGFAKQYSKRQNHSVIGTCRDMSKGEDLKKLGCQVIELDVSSDESCAQLSKRLQDIGVNKINILINNAGIYKKKNELGSDALAKDALEQINTNALGPLRVTNAVLPFLRKGASESGQPARVVNVSSRMGSIGDGSTGGSYGYRASKAAENMISVTLAADLAKDNIYSFAVHPGNVQTKLGGHEPDIDPDTCAAELIKVIENAKKEDCGKFLHRNGSILPW